MIAGKGSKPIGSSMVEIDVWGGSRNWDLDKVSGVFAFG